MTRNERIGQLMALSARRDKAEAARALSGQRALAEAEAAMGQRLRGLAEETAGALGGPAGPATVGGLAAALWLGRALSAEVVRSDQRIAEAEARAATLAAALALRSERERVLRERAATLHRDAAQARDDAADRQNGDRPRR
jgi:hypothetical protein